MNGWYIAGMLAGIIVGLLVVAVLVKVIEKFGGKVRPLGGVRRKDEYDERQQLDRASACKNAYIVLVVYIVLVGMLEQLDITKLFMSFAGMWLGVCISIVVFTAQCILKDAYMNLYENAKGIIMLLGSISILNLFFAIFEFKEGSPMIEQGVLSVNSINLIVGITLLIVVVIFICKMFMNKYAIEEDEDEE